jgi:hypothetical protein
MEWEILFASTGWRKWTRIQEARLQEIKDNAWLLFQDDAKRAQYTAELRLLEELLQFEPDTKKLMEGDQLGPSDDF